jgi:glutamyl-tRNA reductase
MIFVLGGGAYFLYPLFQQRKVSEPLEVLVIRWDDLWENLPETQLLKRNLNQKLENYHQEFSMLEIQLRQENQALSDSQKTVNFKDLSQSKFFEERQKNFAEKVMKTQQEAECRQKNINEHHERSINKLRERIVEVIKEIAKKQKADLVIFHQQCPYYDPKLDITEKVLAVLKTVKG